MILANGDERSCSCNVLIQASRYFCVMLDGGVSGNGCCFAESLSRRIELQHLDHQAVHAILDYLHDAAATSSNTPTEFKLWPNFLGWETEDSAALVQALDYLQIEEYCSGDNNNACNHEKLLDCTIQAVHILHDPSIVRQECIAQRWIDVVRTTRSSSTNTATTFYFRQIPVGKKKRSWRFWVCYFLCLDVMPQQGERMDQMSFTDRLENIEGSGGAVALRRELIEYGLMEREGDGSAYWRPPYTISLLRDRIKGLPRRVM